jgi:hypothetical protein
MYRPLRTVMAHTAWCAETVGTTVFCNSRLVDWYRSFLNMLYDFWYIICAANNALEVAECL